MKTEFTSTTLSSLLLIAVSTGCAPVKEIMRDAITSSRYTYLGKPWTLLVNQVIYENHFAVRLRGKVYVLDVTYEKALETDVTERVMRGFRERGIAAPAILHRSLPAHPGTAGVTA